MGLHVLDVEAGVFLRGQLRGLAAGNLALGHERIDALLESVLVAASGRNRRGRGGLGGLDGARRQSMLEAEILAGEEFNLALDGREEGLLLRGLLLLLERRDFLGQLRDLLDEGVRGGEFRVEQVSLVAACLVGAIAEALVGPLSPPARAARDAGLPATDLASVSLALITFCLRAVGAPES